MAKVKCPLCDTEATWSHQFFTHFIGAHVRGKKDIEGIIDRLEVESEEEHKRNQEQSDNELKIFSEQEREYLIERINNFEPEESNEALISSEDELDAELPGSYDLKNFVSDVCREERHFALLLTNVLSNNGGAVKEKIKRGKMNEKDDFLKDHEVKKVFYEATLMRDYWNLDKERFNKALWEYVKDKSFRNKKKWKTIKEEMLNVKNHANYWPGDYSHPLARWMMNAKPDIAVISYNNVDKEYYLSLIECKYSSDQDIYRYSNDDNVYTLSQLEVQEHILCFLCGLEFPESNNHMLVYYGNKLKKGQVLLVNFDGIHNMGKKNDEGFSLDIKDLINLTKLKKLT